VLLLGKEGIETFFEHVDKLFLDALEKSKWIERYPLESLHGDLVSGECKCWVINDGKEVQGVAVTQDMQYPLGKSLLVFLLAGNNMHEWYKELHDELCAYAKRNNMKWIDACAREGLGKKYLSSIGYSNNANHYSIGVDHG